MEHPFYRAQQKAEFKNPRIREFEPRLGFGGTINLHPGEGEPAIYYGSGHPYTSDYAVLAMLPGLKPEHRVLMLAGTKTYGVQAAADFAARAGSFEPRIGAGSLKRSAIGYTSVHINPCAPVRSSARPAPAWSSITRNRANSSIF
jgi:hypothetical protein